MAITVTKFINTYLPNIIKNTDLIPVMVGNPGISKTQQLHQLCERMNWGLLPVHLALRPIESLSGIPDILRKNINGKETLVTEWSWPEIIAKINELADKHEYAILFFDDIHLADKSRQAYFFELASERALQGYKLKDNVKIVCAGNPTAKAGAKQFLTAIINRFIFVDVVLDANEWISWAYKNDIHNIIIGFISQYPEKLSQGEDTNPFASPRSWKHTSDILKVFSEIYGPINKWNEDVFMELTTILNGTIGKPMTSDFIIFLKYTSDVDIDKIIKNPEELMKIKQPEKRMAVYYTVITELATEKYRKYATLWLLFSYYVLGNNGKAKHFAAIMYYQISRHSKSMLLVRDKELLKVAEQHGYTKEDLNKCIEDIAKTIL